MACTLGAFQSQGSVAGAGRAGRDFVGIVADAVIEVVFAQLRPEGLELVASHAGPGRRSGLVQENRRDSASKAMAGPARDILVLAERRFPLTGRGSEELVVFQHGRRGHEASDLAAVVLVGADPGQVVVEVREPGGVITGLWKSFEQAVGAGEDDVVSRGDIAARRSDNMSSPFLSSCRLARCRRPTARGSSRPLVGQ